ncbi:MAG: SpoIIE family protein phosphatase [Clostridia bacterium]
MNKKTPIYIFYGFLFAGVFFVLQSAGVAEIIYPFGIAFMFALLALKINPLFYCPLFFLSSIAISFSLSTILSSLALISIVVLGYIISKLSNKKIPVYLVIIYLCIGYACKFYYAIINNFIIQTLLEMLVASMFTYIYFVVISAIKARRLQGRFTIDENVCLALCAMSLFLGTAAYNIYSVPLISFLFPFILLLASSLVTREKVLYIACCMGVGVCFYNFSVTILAVVVLEAIVILIADSSSPRLLRCGFLCLTDVVLGTFLNGYAVYSIYNFLAVVIACILFMIIPKKLLDRAQGYIGCGKKNTAIEFAYDIKKNMLRENLDNLANVFFDSSNVYRSLIFEGLNDEEIRKVVKNDVCSKNCKKCINFAKCYRGEDNGIDIALSTLIDNGILKGRVNLIDLPQFIAVNCIQSKSILATLNMLLDKIAGYKKNINTENYSKAVVADQLLCSSNIIRKKKDDFSRDCDKLSDKSKILEEELLYHNVIPREVLVMESCKSGNITSIFLHIRKDDAENEAILLSVKNAFKIPFYVSSSSSLKVSGWKTIELKPLPIYDIAMGEASVRKCESEISGDTFSLTFLPNGKYLIAVCDGMGSGKEAESISNKTIALIESFYRAGFESELIMQSVNRIVSTMSKDSFSATDICLIDLITGELDTIKLGSAISVIKRQDKIEVIESSKLPIGISEEFSVNLDRKILQTGDIVVLVSDGIIDAFSGEEKFIEFVCAENIKNMQLLAESILEEAKELSQNAPNDDMTVVTFRLTQNAC